MFLPPYTTYLLQLMDLCVTVTLGNLPRNPTEKTANGTGKKVPGDANHSQRSEGSVLSVPALY